jgi:hypothetical protein
MTHVPVVVGRDVNLSRAESDLTELDPAVIPSFDPPATYTRSLSFHESEVESLKRGFKQTTAGTESDSSNAFLSKSCESVTDFCTPAPHFLKDFFTFAKESSEKCPNMAPFIDDCSLSMDGKDSIGEDLLIECNQSQRGRLLVWPTLTEPQY